MKVRDLQQSPEGEPGEWIYADPDGQGQGVYVVLDHSGDGTSVMDIHQRQPSPESEILLPMETEVTPVVAIGLYSQGVEQSEEVSRYLDERGDLKN
jgi:hypothetical protein